MKPLTPEELFNCLAEIIEPEVKRHVKKKKK